ncbi:MAG: hypothetical protein HUU08_17885 [Candidatus Brocadia sp.]|nr:hypothetical protein [Candidatus Brocadia sp.]
MENMPSHKYNESTKGREIELSAQEQFPIPVRVIDDSGRVIENYRIEKTKSNKFMMQK